MPNDKDSKAPAAQPGDGADTGNPSEGGDTGKTASAAAKPAVAAATAAPQKMVKIRALDNCEGDIGRERIAMKKGETKMVIDGIAKIFQKAGKAIIVG